MSLTLFNQNEIKHIKMKNIYKLLIPVVVSFFIGCNTLDQKKEKKSYGETALEESAIPVRPGIPGERPFWNYYSQRFIYAPAFDFKPVENAEEYRFDIMSIDRSATYSFEANKPYEPLTPVWVELPVGSYQIQVTGVGNDGKNVGLAGEREFYRAAPFNGIYHEPVLPYDKSAELALEKLMEKDYVSYWLTNKKPDPDYLYYRYPTKMFGALIVGAVTYARLKPNSAEATSAKELALIVADFLIEISNPKGTPLEYFPPTYRGHEDYDAQFNKSSESHMKSYNTMIPYAADAGHAYLDLYDYTGEEKYFEAAKKIASTYKKNQLENGSWYLYVDNRTGEPTASNISIPTSTINYFNRLSQDYGVEDLSDATEAALNWIMVNPVETFNWQGQFEDVKASQAYQNHSREQACELAIYLFKNNSDISLAEDLVRFSEDQFVIWEQPLDIEIELMEQNSSRLGYQSKNWITPCVQEQYEWWMPVSRSAGIMIDTLWEAYKATGNDIYLAKARSIANSFTVVQKAHNGEYPTYFTKYPMGVWLNNTVYPAKVMRNFQENLDRL